MKVVNNSLPEEYYNQRNNRRNPYSACFFTSLIDAAVAAKWPIPEARPGEDEQPEDRLMMFGQSDSVTQEKWRACDPGRTIPFYEWMEVGVVALNGFLGAEAAQFIEGVPPANIVANLEAGGAAVLLGTFPLRAGGSIRHYVAIVGAAWEELCLGMPEVAYWTIDDPYGDHRTFYQNQCGNDVPMGMEEYVRIFDPGWNPAKTAVLIGPYRKG